MCRKSAHESPPEQPHANQKPNQNQSESQSTMTTSIGAGAHHAYRQKTASNSGGLHTSSHDGINTEKNGGLSKNGAIHPPPA